MKNDQYFQWKACMMSDDRVIALTETMGMEGYGIYTALLGELRQRDDYRCALASLPALARRWNVTVEKLRKVVTGFKLFTVIGETNEELSFASDYLDEVMQELEAKRKKSVTGGKSRASIAKRRSDGRFENERQDENPMDGQADLQPEAGSGIPAGVQPGGETHLLPGDKADVRPGRRADIEPCIQPDVQPCIQPGVQPEEKRRAEKRRVEKEKPLLPIHSWETCVDEAFGHPIWLEIQAMHSGMRGTFMERLPQIVDFFKRHIITYGKESAVLSPDDAKNYFSNFIRPGTPTRKALDAELHHLENAHRKQDAYRYEEINPTTGARSYCGQSIPKDAPPRPTENAVWSPLLRQWS